jgi:hypothetical protein
MAVVSSFKETKPRAIKHKITHSGGQMKEIPRTAAGAGMVGLAESGNHDIWNLVAANAGVELLEAQNHSHENYQ